MPGNLPAAIDIKDLCAISWTFFGQGSFSGGVN
jgi:hypothetical protein